jgi:hypothetical protein
MDSGVLVASEARTRLASRCLERSEVVQTRQIVGRGQMMQPPRVLGYPRRHQADRREQDDLDDVRLPIAGHEHRRIGDVVQHDRRDRCREPGRRAKPQAGKNDRQVIEVLERR